MITRRDLTRLTILSLAALGGAGTLTGCSDEKSPNGKGGGGVMDDGGIQLVSSDVKRAAGDPTILPDVVTGLQALTHGLYDGVAAGTDNVVISPYSVLIALGMTLVGADGKTADEMREVLGTGSLGDRWHKGVNALTVHIDGLAGTQKRVDGSKAELELATANQLFGQRDVGWEQDFVDLLAKEYGASVRAVDFVQATEEARTLINGWVEEQTNDRIVDLVPEAVLDALTRLVLVNAIYLKAPWEQPFEKPLTAAGAFHRADGSSIDVDLMHKPDLAAAMATGDGWQAVVLPYAGKKVAMTIVLPDADAFDEVERAVASKGFTHIARQATPTSVDLKLPKWKFRTEVLLNEVLAALGMPTAFSDDADFTPMTDEDLTLRISAVLHQGFIAVDEEGTEAAAATAVVMKTLSAPAPGKTLVIDRPFLFAIHDVEHHAPLFVGRVSDPTA
ncbi:serpin B [Nocardioides daedukensis]|uniref:Serpin B n=1 Tax=Nocardioides daedukensis TaxID=634462 RepID=A0A7Y9RYM9_9ACTN|nr:serpin family protein [Nocardioides daedukensis]NYG57138.1 serpin B [Nocardioides daedukensis]